MINRRELDRVLGAPTATGVQPLHGVAGFPGRWVAGMTRQRFTYRTMPAV